MAEFKKLAEPFAIGKMQMKNRIVFAPTAMAFGGPNGEVTDQNLCHYVARAQGGVGFIVVEHTLVSYKFNKGPLGIQDNSCRRGWWEISHAIHHYGVKAVVQLGLGHGAQTGTTLRPDVVMVSASDVPMCMPRGNACAGFKEWEGSPWETPRPLTIEEIKELEDASVTAALRVKQAGFDGVEIHAAHGYLLSSFLSPYSNKRTDQYGGSFEKRLTLAKNIIRKTRQALGEDLLLGLRLSLQEHIEGGYNLKEGCRIAKSLEAEGLDYIHASTGRFESMKYLFPKEEGAILSEAQAVKNAVSIPVICPNIHTPATGEQALREGMADAISLSRGLIADPQWANKALSGREDEIIACVRCNNCLKGLKEAYGARCTVNPEVGRERFLAQYAPPPLGAK
ncbi:MAG: NADH:flavin oxidoreductase [Candidatus Tectomicrobia bacterium]|uniref:NADH:flavin oxidoreductase n=1 Tax=Tectimicrobiota bacterium TaxID=2528274 RepID=A0A933GK58_UNCTE|nr:NADH:flavin oxidoreductase [Candidatus Tectomicrobia bacterium]